jgi:outer membrane protein assembly factor BamB
MRIFSISILLSAACTSLFSQEVLNPDTIWRFKTVGYTPSFPYVDDKIAVIGDESAHVYALNVKTGEKVWDCNPGAGPGSGKKSIIHSIVGDSKYLYFNNCSASVWAIDRATGKVIWRYDQGRFDDDVFTRIVQTDSTIILNTLVPSVLCLRKKDGHVSWEFKDIKERQEPSAICMEKGKIYFSCRDSSLLSLDAGTGKKLWTITTRSAAMPFGPVVLGDLLIAVLKDSVAPIQCFSITTQKLKWEMDADRSMIFGHDGKVFVFGKGVLCLDAQTGKELWKIDGDFTWYTAPFFTDKKIFYHNRIGNTLWVIEEDTGKALQKYTMQGKTYTVPFVTDKYIFYGLSKTFNCMKRQ